MKTRIIIGLLTTFLVFTGITTVFPQSPEQLYQKGLMQEEGEGNLQEAINIYNSVVENQNADQSLQAKALLHVGLCYEKLGKEEATKAYQKLVNNFPSQKNEVAIARERLSRLILAVEKLAQKEDSKDLVIRKFMEGTGSEFYGAPSPDGKYFAFVDYKTFPNDIIIKDIETENEIRLKNQVNLNHDGDKGTPYNPIWSPDSKQIAYVWENDKDNFYKLLVINVKSPKPKILFRVNYNNGWIKTEDWSPDGKYILVQLTENNMDQLGLVSVLNGSFQQLKKIGKTAPYSAKFSPDGKFVAFDNPPNEENTEHDIFVIQIDDKKETKITSHPSHDYFLDWSTSGEKILFASDRTGTTDMWSISFSGGSGQKTPELVSENIGNIKALGTTNEGSFYYSTPGSWWDIFSTTINPESGKVIEPPKEIPLPYQGFNRHPVWSPDGKYLAYVSVRRHLRKPNILCIYTKETGAIKEFAFGKDVNRPVWFPDSRSVLLFGTDILNITSGKIESVIQLQKDEELEKFAISISSDGKYIYYEIRNKNWDKHSIIRRDFGSSEEKEIYTTSDDNLTMSLSPDNKQLALLQRHNKNTRILKIVSVTDSSEKIIHTFKQDDFGYVDLTWSPNGKYICFSKKADSDWVLFRIPAIGGVAENLDVHKNLFTSISIHPNGQLIAFSSFVGKEKPGGIWVMENFLPLEKLSQNNEAEAAKEPEGIRIRQISKESYLDDLGTVSSDGRYLSCVDWGDGDLAIRDLKSGEKKLLMHNATLDEDPQKFVIGSAISKNGKKVAYSWWRPYHTFDLHIFDMESNSSKLLYKEENVEAYPLAWLSDEKLVAIRQDRNTESSHITLFSVLDGTFQDLKSFDKRIWFQLCVCPDGKFIAFNTITNDNGNSDISLLKVDDKTEIPLVIHPANDKVLGWIPGRNEFLFISDRAGTWDLWSIQMINDKPSGEPRRLFSEIGEVAPVGITENGECFYGFSKRNFNAYILPVNKLTGKPEGKPEIPLAGSIYSKNWSPDGKYMARVQEGKRSFELILSDVENGNERRLAEELFHPMGPYWSKDRQSVYIFGLDQNKFQTKGYKGGIFTVDLKSNKLKENLLISDYKYTPSEDDALPISGHVVSDDQQYIFMLFQNDWIIKHNLNNGKDTILYRHPKFVRGVLQLSPDGNKLLFAIQNKGEKMSRLMTISTQGGDEKELCRSQESNISGSAFWSPDGKYVYFSERPEGTNLWRVDANGGTPEKVWKTDKGAESFVMHPSGEKISYSVRERITEVRVIEGLVNELDKIYSQNE